MGNDLGDFQTPPDLVSRILATLQRKGKWYGRVLEPTCGRGNFISGLLQIPAPPVEIQAIELQHELVAVARNLSFSSNTTTIVVQQANLFQIHLSHFIKWGTNGDLLVVGNPPWVTNSTLGSLGSQNIPKKENLKRLRGIEARTGSSNFDIAEYIWVKLITELISEKPTIALLCKTTVARNVLKYCYDNSLPIGQSSMTRIDTRRWFHVSIDACLFCVDIGTECRNYYANVYGDLQAKEPESHIGVKKGHIIANIQNYEALGDIDGECSLIWRQGIKHDAASIMELLQANGDQLINKMGEPVCVEEAFVYPLLKGSDVSKDIFPHRFVIVTQKHPGDDTGWLKHEAPLLWAYLENHADIFDRRKSSVYVKKPRFAMFGVGKYTFSLYKVAVSGLHKKPAFRAIGPVNQKPVLLDDTCYFVPMSNPLETALLASLLNDKVCLQFIEASTFKDSKRPITKKLLQRVNLEALFERAEQTQIVQRAITILRNLAPDQNEQKIGEDGYNTVDLLRHIILQYQAAIPGTRQS